MGTGHRIPPGDIENLTIQQYGSSQDGTPWGNIAVPMYKRVTLDSQTTVATSGQGSWMSGLGYFKTIDVLIALTAAGGTTPTLDIFIETKPDGTNSMGLAHFTQFTTDSTAQAVIRLNKTGSVGEITGILSAPGAGTVRNIGWGDALSVRRAITGTSPSYSYIVTINCIA